MGLKKGRFLSNADEAKWTAELTLLNTELAFQKAEKGKCDEALILVNAALASERKENTRRSEDLLAANKELAFASLEKRKRQEELLLANLELDFQNLEKCKRASELMIATEELAFQNQENEKRSAELIVANIELVFQTQEKGKRATELVIANIELAFENEKKEKRAAELIIANLDLVYQYEEKEKREKTLMIANRELSFQNEEKEKRAAELIIANQELAFQNTEKEKRATELIVANKELVFQSEEKGKRATELILANIELAFQNEEKGKRAAELIIANHELAFQNQEKEKRVAELIFANNELLKAEEQFRLVVESAPNAMVLINDQGTITLVNNETDKLFGYQRQELIGRKLVFLIPERLVIYHSFHENIISWKAKTDIIGSAHDVFGIRKNGSKIQVDLGLNSIETSKGKMILASIIDITKRKIQESVLNEHNRELGQMVYVASHDLQEPLRTVSNYLKAFEEEYLERLDVNAGKYIQSINQAVKRMSLLIQSLLNFSRLGYNKKLVLVDCGKIVDDVKADLANMIHSSKAIVEVDVLPCLYVYEMEIRQLFQNLITNALKFNKIGIPPHIRISALQTNDKWRFSVSDMGIGIDPQYSEKVFEIFQRLHSKQEYEGSGIGLANCKKIVQLHLGEIWVESVEGEGSTFYFTIANLLL